MKTLQFASVMLMLVLFSTSCKEYTYLPKPAEVPFYTYGSDITLYRDNGSKLTTGELLAIDSARFYILTDEAGLREIQRSSVAEAVLRVARTSNNPGAINTWGCLLPLTTLAHGFFFIITAPINLACGVPIGIDASSSTYKINYPDQIKWNELAKFARFPQGIPSNVDIQSIK